jgi:hypothetical protein
MSAESPERLEILELIQQGKINPREGLKLIEALNESLEVEEHEYIKASEEMLYGPPSEGDTISVSEGMNWSSETDLDPDQLETWRGWWVIPFWIGVGITILGGILMYWAYSSRGFGVGFFASWIPFLIGLGTMVLGWNSRTGPWIHIRIQQRPGESPQKISVSLPLPVRFIAWTLRTFERWIPDLPSGTDQVLLALGSYSQGDPPLTINVDDEDDDQKVLIYIG